MKIGRPIRGTFVYALHIENIRIRTQNQLFDNLYCMAYSKLWEYVDNKRKPLQQEIEIWT